MHIYLICTGNTCRSPMAQQILSRKLPYEIIESRGLLLEVAPISEGTARVLQEKYACEQFIKNHFSIPVDGIDVMLADVLVTMERSQKSKLLERFATFSHKIYTLGEIIGDAEYDVKDPLQASAGPRAYDTLFDDLDKRLSEMAKVIWRYQRPFSPIDQTKL